MTISVRQLLDEKGYEIHSVTSETTVYDTIKLMSERGIGAVLVIDNERIAGILSERDYTRKIVLKNRSSKDTQVREIMTEEVIFVTPDQHIEDCMEKMSHYHIRHMPVLENDKPIGMLSVMDVMRNILSQKELLISQLESYISGNG